MKINGLRSLCLMAVAALAAGCADSASEDVKAETTCTANVCKDSVTLRLCENGTFGNEVECRLGCMNDACVQNACTVSFCADTLTLAQCTNGTLMNVPCANGCEAGACKATTGNNCVQSVCRDSNTLLNCVGGIQTPITCPYGCDKDTCKTACTMDVCKDGGTLAMCENGVTTDVSCVLGCSAGKCNTACISDFCRDNSILMVCDAGQIKPINCPYGCLNDKCNMGTTVCAENAVSCDGAYVQTCISGNWVKAAEPCTNGCEDGLCKGEIPSGDCTNGDKKCDGDNLLTCKNNAWSSEKCENTYSSAAILK